MKVPRLGVISELQLQPMPQPQQLDLSHICDLHHSSLQCQIPNPLSKARGQTLASGILVKLVSTAPQRELLNFRFFENLFKVPVNHAFDIVIHEE